MLGLVVVVLDAAVLGVVVVNVLVVVGVLVLVVGVVVVEVTVIEGSSVVEIMVVLAAVVVLGLTTTNEKDMMKESDLCFLETISSVCLNHNTQLSKSTHNHESVDICFFKVCPSMCKLDLGLCISLPVTQRRMSGPSSMLSGQAHVYLGEWSVI